MATSNAPFKYILFKNDKESLFASPVEHFQQAYLVVRRLPSEPETNIANAFVLGFVHAGEGALVMDLDAMSGGSRRNIDTLGRQMIVVTLHSCRMCFLVSSLIGESDTIPEGYNWFDLERSLFQMLHENALQLCGKDKK